MTDVLGAVVTQIAVYIDFDNIVMSRYDELHGRESFRDDNANATSPKPVVRQKLAEAKVNLGLILDYASTFGTVVMCRAYADWSRPVPRSYAIDTLKRSMDLVQMFPMTGTKNGADIRLAIDVTDDLSRYPNITHVLVVAGDSDYVSLAQRCKRRGRTVIGVGAGKSVGQYWEAACDEFRLYGALVRATAANESPPSEATNTTRHLDEDAPTDPEVLLVRAAKLVYLKASADWISAGTLKMQMRRLDPAFDENALGHKTFTGFLRAMDHLVEYETNTSGGAVYLKELGIRATPSEPTDVLSAQLVPPPPATTESASAPGSVPVTGRTRLTDLGGVPVDGKLSDPGSIDLKIRSDLNLPVSVVVGVTGERCMLESIRIAWDIVAERREGSLSQVTDEQLRVRGWSDQFARRARALVSLCVPALIRDEDMSLRPNSDFVGLDDARLLMVVRRMMADRSRHRFGSESVSAEDVGRAVHGDSVPSDALAAYESALTVPGVDEISAAVGQLLIPAPVLWDVGAAATGLPRGIGIAGQDQLLAALAAPLVSSERDPNSLPISAIHEAFRAAGLIDQGGFDHGGEPNEIETADIVGRLVQAWLARAMEMGMALSADDPVTMEAMYRLVLPDRMQGSWRRWLRQLVLDQSSRPCS